MSSTIKTSVVGSQDIVIDTTFMAARSYRMISATSCSRQEWLKRQLAISIESIVNNQKEIISPLHQRQAPSACWYASSSTTYLWASREPKHKTFPRRLNIDRISIISKRTLKVQIGARLCLLIQSEHVFASYKRTAIVSIEKSRPSGQPSARDKLALAADISMK